VALQLKAKGWDAAVLEGGLDAWRAGHDVEPIAEVA
jgi:rhodanese-related sulfurtransferase